HPERAADVPAPVFPQGTAAATADVDPAEGAGARVEAGRKDDDIELVQGSVLQQDAFRHDLDDRVVPDPHRLDVFAVVDFQVVGLQRHPRGPEAVVGGNQKLDQLRVFQAGAHLLPDEL